MNKEKFLNELKRTRSQAKSLMYSLYYLLEETVYDARDYVDNELMKPIFDELDNQEQAVMNGEVSDSRRVKDERQVFEGQYIGDSPFTGQYQSIIDELLSIKNGQGYLDQNDVYDVIDSNGLVISESGDDFEVWAYEDDPRFGDYNYSDAGIFIEYDNEKLVKDIYVVG